jgi:hypothetical protein
LAAVAYGPSEVSTTVRGGTPVTVEEQTDYPFRETITLTVKPAKPVAFPLVLRIPAWANGAAIKVNGQPQTLVKAGSFRRIERAWKGGDAVEIRLPMQTRISNWYNNSVALERGPLVYSLKVGESWHKIKQTGPATDWEVFPSTPWNYALMLDPKSATISFVVKEKPMTKQPFSAETAPVEITAQARRLPAWQLVDDSAGPLPVSPVTSKRPDEMVTLVPYGAAKLRITAFPYMLPIAAAPAH